MACRPPGRGSQQHAPPAWLSGAGRRRVAGGAARRSGPGARCRLVAAVRARAATAGAAFATVLDVGQGLAVALETHRHARSRHARTDDADAGGRIAAPFLRAAGIARLGGLIVSHQDSDHSGGAAATLLRTVPVDWVLSSLPDEHERAGRGRQRTSARCVVWRASAGIGTGLRFAALYRRPRSTGCKTNDLSCVVRVESDYGSALLTGDIEARSETNRGGSDALAADVLLVPHHGSRTSSTPPSPRLPPRSPCSRPATEPASGIRGPRWSPATGGAQLWRTDFDGALTFDFAPGATRRPRAARDQALPLLAQNRGDLEPGAGLMAEGGSPPGRAGGAGLRVDPGGRLSVGCRDDVVSWVPPGASRAPFRCRGVRCRIDVRVRRRRPRPAGEARAGGRPQALGSRRPGLCAGQGGDLWAGFPGPDGGEGVSRASLAHRIPEGEFAALKEGAPTLYWLVQLRARRRRPAVARGQPRGASTR